MTLQDNAAFYREVGKRLEDWGWGDFLNFWPGWGTRTNSSTIKMPTGVTIHHTGGKATATSYLINPVDRPQLKVLANVHIDVLERRIRFICAGGASHGGFTFEPCFDRIVAGTAPLDRDLEPGPDSETFSINKRTVGVEVDGVGGSGEWDDWTYRAAVALSAACQHVAGWPLGDAPRVGAHKEHTRRKPGDPFVNMGTFRTDVKACLADPWGPNTGRPEFVLGDRVLSRDGIDSGPDVSALIDLLVELGYELIDDGLFGPAVERAVTDFQLTHGLVADGIVRGDTVQALRLALTAPASNETETPGPVEPEAVIGPVAEQTATERDFRFGQANLHAERFGGPERSTPNRGEFLRDVMKCSIYALCEISEEGRDAIREVLGMDRVLTFPVGLVCVMWDARKWKHRGRKVVAFPTPVHGAVRVTLDDTLGSGLSMDVISVHIRPGAVTDLAGKQADIRKALTLVRDGVPTIIAGDWNTATAFDLMKPKGFVRATPKVDTLNAVGEQRLDAVFVTPDLTIRGSKLIDPGGISDHKVWIYQGTLKAR